MIRLPFGRRARTAQTRLDDARWQRLLAGYPFVHNLGAARLLRLREQCEQFLQRKQFAAEGGLVLTDDIGTAIALQACVPIVELGLGWYDDFEQIVVYPDQFVVPRREIDDAGVVHEEDAWLAGESIDGGPVVLSWADVAPGVDTVNVVIHEFVHKIDLRDGEADGCPPLPAARRRRWQQALNAAWQAFTDELDALERAMPRWLDPESEQAEAWYARLPLDPYAAHDPAEFFAVSGEAFFLAPGVLARAYPEYFTLLAEFFRLDPRTGSHDPGLSASR